MPAYQSSPGALVLAPHDVPGVRAPLCHDTLSRVRLPSNRTRALRPPTQTPRTQLRTAGSTPHQLCCVAQVKPWLQGKTYCWSEAERGDPGSPPLTVLPRRLCRDRILVGLCPGACRELVSWALTCAQDCLAPPVCEQTRVWHLSIYMCESKWHRMDADPFWSEQQTNVTLHNSAYRSATRTCWNLLQVKVVLLALLRYAHHAHTGVHTGVHTWVHTCVTECHWGT